MQRKIQKVKLEGTGKVSQSYEEFFGEEHDSDVVEKKGGAHAHPDLVSIFGALKIHLATLCEQGEFTEFEDYPEKLEIFEVTQVSFGGDDEHQGVTLTGMRRLKDNRVLNLNAPFCKLNPDHSHYPYAQSLEMVIQELLVEADAYLNGKHAPSPQLNLFDGPQEDEVEQDEEEAEEKPKARRRSKKLPKDHPLVRGLGIEVSVEE